MSQPTKRPDFQRFLKRLTSRSVLSQEEQNAILGLPGYAEQVHSNRDFVQLGEHLDHSCLVVAGFVGRFNQNREGARQITALHLPGDLADLHTVVQPEATSALQALSTATIVRIPHSAVRALASQYPAVAEAFWRDCTVDASILSQWIFNVGRRDARRRIAHLVCEIAVRTGAAPSEGSIVFPFPLTQTQLADASALTPVHVNRTVQGLRREGLADIRNSTRIENWRALTEAADFDPQYLQLRVRPRRNVAINSPALEMCELH